MLLRICLTIAILAGACCSSQTLPVLMMSDLHFDPLHDPGKAARLAAAPESAWTAILREPGDPAKFEAIQEECGSRRGEDTDFPLLTASLQAMHSRSPRPDFVTLTGDLLVHQFECRWRFATGHDEGYADFAEKTTRFVIDQVTSSFPGVPVYIALGNNDSSCGDYRMDLHDRYLRAVAPALLRGLVGAGAAERAAATRSFLAGGYFSVAMPGARNARLLVLDDIYLSRKYSTCNGQKDPAPGQAVTSWLNTQLLTARRRGERVWVLAHIPPGVDVYSTVTRPRDVCSGADPEMFLTPGQLGETLARYPDVVRLALFGHTHSDEVRLIGEIPAKLVGSVTTVNGNLPSFTVAQLDPRSAQMDDYSVYVAGNQTGAGPWSREYNYRETFGADAFNATHLHRQIDAFHRDAAGEQDASQAYQRNFFPGAPSPLGLIWPQAVCALGGHTADDYRRCSCAAAK